ncbi:MAG: error-prone DNA polymerase [Arcanobacterium sp.]
MSYAELHVHSAYSFLDGVSLPEELVRRAVELELDALALTDHDGLPGVVQFAQAARKYGMPTVIGSEISMQYVAPECQIQLGTKENTAPAKSAGQRDPDAAHLLVLARQANGYRNLSRALAQGMLATGSKGQASYTLESLAQAAQGQWQILTGCRKGHVRRALERNPGVWAPDAAARELDRLVALFGRENVAVELISNGQPHDVERNRLLAELGARANVSVVATGNVHMARITDAPLADVVAATRAQQTLEQMRPWLPPWPSYLRSEQQMRQIHAEHLSAVSASAQIGHECAFDVALVSPNLPPFPVPPGHTEASWLATITEKHAAQRYGPRGSNNMQGTKNARAWELIDYELKIINELGFPGYFLIVHNIVEFCQQHNIWCQGRGSAANSAVCFALGITAVDAVEHKMLFERFLSPGRSGPPDIDLDIEAGRREEVIQYVYQRYGRTHAAQVANVITYRKKSAIRDAGRALDYDPGLITRWTKMVGENDAEIPLEVRQIATRLRGLPRYLGIHSGGMVLCDRPMIEVCPVGWATKPGRTVLQWDKDDCADAGLVKFDLLGLGMLTALRLAFTEIAERGIRGSDGHILDLHNIAQDDERVYDLLCAADTVGVFQVESRAQMATLPRLRPRTFYDIVIEVALIRPGPIQGDSVNPYLARRRGREKVSYPHPLLENALKKTLGVPLFQEQLMQIAIDAAGFTPAQADRLRKAMGAKRSHERMTEIRDELMAGMSAKGIDENTSGEIYTKLEAFAEFGFPESHAFSFAYLVYASAWLKVHYPENFYAGIIAAQPMGFYSVNTLISDARAHGVLILPIDVCYSDEKIKVEVTAPRVITNKHPLVDVDPERGLRLGLSAVKGLKNTVIRKILAAREQAHFKSVRDLAQRAELTTASLEKLASAGALRSLGVSRREGLWAANALGHTGRKVGQWFQPVLPGTEIGAHAPCLPGMSREEETLADFTATGFSALAHPLELIRRSLEEEGVYQISQAITAEIGKRIEIAGIVTHRQRPATAVGITFLSLEDETGLLNIVCSAGLWQRYRTVLRTSSALIIRGVVQRADGAVNFVADAARVLPLPVRSSSRDFR